MLQAVTQEVDRKGKIELLSRMHRNVIVCCPLTFQRVTVGCTFILHLTQHIVRLEEVEIEVVVKVEVEIE
jgi:hypothetical protein